MATMKELEKKLQNGEMYNNTISIRAVEEKDDYLVVRAIANKFLDANGTPIVDNHGTILTQATLDTSSYMKNNSVVLAFHNSERPVGKTISLNMKEDGLEVIMEIYKDNDHQIFNQVKRGTLAALSVGMYILDSEYSAILDAVIIRKAELAEISLVTNPSNPLSFIEAVDMCSLGVCSAIRSSKSVKENRNVDKEAFKAMIKQMVVDGELDLAPRVDPVVEEVVVPVVEEVIIEDVVVPVVEEVVVPIVEEVVVPVVPIVEEVVVPVVPIVEEVVVPIKTFEQRLEEAAVAFANKEEGKELTSEQVNLLTFIVMNYGSIEAAVKSHLEK